MKMVKESDLELVYERQADLEKQVEELKQAAAENPTDHYTEIHIIVVESELRELNRILETLGLAKLCV